MSNITRATAADLRSHFNHPRYGKSRIAKLSPEAALTVAARPNLRGRVHKEAVEVFNKANEGKGLAYWTGATKEANGDAMAQAVTNRAKAFDANVAVGQRGPLSNAAKEALGLPVAKKAAPKSRKGK